MSEQPQREMTVKEKIEHMLALDSQIEFHDSKGEHEKAEKLDNVIISLLSKMEPKDHLRYMGEVLKEVLDKIENRGGYLNRDGVKLQRMWDRMDFLEAIEKEHDDIITEMKATDMNLSE